VLAPASRSIAGFIERAEMPLLACAHVTFRAERPRAPDYFSVCGVGYYLFFSSRCR
jgi:hypothetical protein